MEQGKLPLSGIRVCDFSWFAAAPIATKTLADFGAEVIKMEWSAHPDLIRLAMPHTPGTETDLNTGGWFNNYNSSKLCLGMNIAHPKAKEVYDRLIMISDVVVENFSPAMTDKYGIKYENYVDKKPDIIWVDQPMQGLIGPHRTRAGFGAVITPMSGLSYITGFPGRAPVGTNTNYTDYVINPGHLAIATMAALRRRKRTGKGQHIVMSQLASGTTVLGTTILDYTVNGRIREKAGNTSPWAAPHGCYKCKGESRNVKFITPLGVQPGLKAERWCVIACFSDEHWWALCDVIGNPAWTVDPKFSTLLARKENEAELDQLIGEWTIDRSPEEVMMLLQQVGVPAGVVQDAEDILGDPHLRSRDYFVYLDHSVAGHNAYDGIGYKLSATPGKLTRPAPRVGEHTEYICKEILGMAEEEITELIVEGLFEIG
ncbi:MAG: CoA transferase [Deltaproteobacteria bacterium]|nr:CoA transferase [Deltaproteobacteria bacterium]